jgi:two-component system, NarL family, sensor kinase
MKIFFTTCNLLIYIVLFAQSDIKSEWNNDVDSMVQLAYQQSESLDMTSAIKTLEDIFVQAVKKADIYTSLRLLKEMGVIFEMQGDYQKSVDVLMKALGHSEQYHFEDITMDIHINLGIVYFNLRNGEMALEEYREALRIASHLSDTVRIVKVLNNMGNAYMTIYEEMQIAEQYFVTSIELAQSIGFETAVQVGYNNLTQIYLFTGRIKEAENTVLQAYKMDSLNPYVNYNVANFYVSTGLKTTALKYYLRADQLSVHELELKQVILNDISELYAELGNFELAYSYNLQFSENREKLHNLETQKFILDLQARYENDKKEQEIKFLKIQKDKALRMIVTLVIGIAALISLIFFLILYVRNQRIIVRQKNELYQRELQRMEQEKMFVALNAGLKGEEQERERLSRDLHDGLGGMLSGLKMAMLNNFQASCSQETVQQTVGIIDDIVAEVRYIAGNVTPESLKNHGLKEAVHAFCSSFQLQVDYHLKFHFFGVERRFLPAFELAVYRIGQELINNAVKYSGSAVIEVQLMIESNRLFLSVTDFGTDAAIEKLNFVNGKGLSNVKQRVESFGGRFEISSHPGYGTECVVEFADIKTNLLDDD